MTVVIEERPIEVAALPAPDEASLLLERAADLLEVRGWCQKHYLDVLGRMCVLGALKVAADRADYAAARGSAEQDAYGRLRSKLGEVVDWNDHVCRDQREAVRMLREVAAR